MVKKCLSVLCLFLFALLVYADIAPAEIKADYGGSLRLRQEYWENVIDLETLKAPDRDFFRLRTSLWGKVDFNPNIGIYTRVTNEARYYLGNFKPFEIAPGRPGYETSDSDRFDEDELIIDNLYLDVKNIFGLPLDLRIGRQDFLGQYGEGFVILDGTPGDGSRTFYFNAAKATLKLHKNHSVDFIYIYNRQIDDLLPSLYPARSDYLAGYYRNRKVLNVSDERGYVVYGKSKLNDYFSIEPYFIRKEEDSVGRYGHRAPGPKSELHLNTYGGRVVFTAANWKIRGEYARQYGEYDDHGKDRDREGDGGYIFIGQKYAELPFKPEWELGYIYLSGDERGTSSKHEGWNPLFSRAPSWNEILVYPMVYESMPDAGAIPAYWTNLRLYKLGMKLNLAKTTNLALSYQYLRAVEKTNISSPVFSNDSKERGHIGTLLLAHSFTKQIDGFLQIEYFAPGAFYGHDAEDAIFARWQLQFRF
ncbi:MAG: alginate export family protein [Syntrophales bacterium]|nr:alginate export family protein [Deltaproteobacteria bacterium]